MKSISSIAESILLGDESELLSTGKIASQSLPKCEMDISNVEVPDSFAESCITGKPIVIQEEASVVEPKAVKESISVKDLVLEFSELVVRAKELITEMTSCGAIGVSMVEKPKKPKKESPKPRTKDNEKREAMLLRIRKKINV